MMTATGGESRVAAQQQLPTCTAEAQQRVGPRIWCRAWDLPAVFQRLRGQWGPGVEASALVKT